ncbi:MAG TPA: hypothetical protein DHN33_06110 [Eubacteriaceae bacterium]|nr:hypothetical protein [Eubacteriaceae bacterium]
MKNKDTKELLNVLKNTTSIDELEEYLDENPLPFESNNLTTYFNQLMQKRRIEKKDVVKHSQLPRTYAYQILNGTKNPSRDKLLCLCFALNCTLDEAQKMLTLGHHALLYSKSRRDAILIFAIQKKLSLIDVNELLYDFNEKTLYE